MIQAAFLDADGDVGVLPGPVGMDQRQAELASADVHDIDRLAGDARRKIAIRLVELDDPLLVFLELGGVVGLAEQVLQENGLGDADGAQILHGPPHEPVAEYGVAFKIDGADLDLRSLIHLEHDVQRRRRKRLQLRHDRGELPAALGQVILQDHLGALDLVPVIGRFRRQPDAAFFEPVQDFGRRDRFQPVVLDGAHHRPLGDDERHDPAGLARLSGHFDIVEAGGIPQRDQIAVQRVGIVRIAALGEDHGAQRVLRNLARAPEVDGLDGIGRRTVGGGCVCRGSRWPGVAGLAGSGLGGGGFGSSACGTCSNGLGGLGCCGAGCCWPEKGNRCQQANKEKGRAQASRPGKLHLDRVPFHSAPNFFDVLPPNWVSRNLPQGPSGLGGHVNRHSTPSARACSCLKKACHNISLRSAESLVLSDVF